MATDREHQRLARDRVGHDLAAHAEDALDEVAVEHLTWVAVGEHPSSTHRDEPVGVARREVEVVQDHGDRRAARGG